MKHIFDNFHKYRYLLYELIKKDIKLKYRSSVLGVLWTLLEPLLTMIILTLVFSNLLGRGDENFPVYILCGRLLYNYFSNSTKTALKSVRKHGNMISKVYVPKYMYPLASVISNYVIFLISMIVLFGVMVYERVPITVYMLGALAPLVILFILAVGAGLLLSTMDVFFGDMEYLWSLALMIIMYASAIFYYADSLITSSNAWIFRFNPLYGLIANFRNAVFGRPLDPYYLWYSLGFSVVTFVIGLGVFKHKQDQFILYL